MKYFKNTDLARLYKVSEKSVRNWIDAAETGKLNLQLHQENNKSYIANVANNTATIEQLVEKGKKYKNTRGFKVVRPSAKFYSLYSPKQILDIITNIDTYREIPVQYTYFNSGAKDWDTYTNRLLTQETPNSVTSTLKLLHANMDYFDWMIEGYSKVNVIDLGPGNALPIRGLLEHCLQKGILKRYIGIDLSKELLEIAKQNIETWFEGGVAFEGHIRDIVYERFDDLLVSESFADSDQVLNVVIFFGGTLNNFRDPNHVLATIHDSLGKNDVLLFSKKLDTEKSRRYFEQTTSDRMELVLRLLNIDKTYYTLEQYFDEQKMARELQARLNVALNIEFELYGKKRTIELNKGDSILLWRARHQMNVEAIKQFDDNGFEILQSARSKDLDYLLLTSKVKTGIRR